MQVLKKNLKATQDMQKIYADQHKTLKEFQFEEHVYFHIKPKLRSLKIRSCTKLAPRYCGPFEILERIGTLAYKIALPMTVNVHDVFHVSLLKKYVKYVDNVID